jgi:DNA-packaging protein gp3
MPIVNKNTVKAHEGRPTKYRPKFCEDLIKYFDIEPHFETPVTITFKNGTTKEEVKLMPSDLPTLAGFAVKIGVHRDTITEWATAKDNKGQLKHPEFSVAIKRAKEFQENILVTNGLQGLYAQPFAILTAKNILNWRDKNETDLTSGGKPLVEFDLHGKDKSNGSDKSST